METFKSATDKYKIRAEDGKKPVTEKNSKEMFDELALKYHEDRGGDHESMVNLNLAKEKCDEGDCEDLVEIYKTYKKRFEITC